MNRCENCFEWCGEKQGCDSDNAIICRAINEHPYWKPDYPTLEAENAELKQELEVCKKALRLMAKAKLSERMEQVLKDEIEKEVIWFMGMVERAEARKELTK